MLHFIYCYAECRYAKCQYDECYYAERRGAPTIGIRSVGSQWKRINRKQIARWQHLSRLKASAFLIEFILLGVKKYNNLYLRLVTPSGG